MYLFIYFVRKKGEGVSEHREGGKGKSGVLVFEPKSYNNVSFEIMPKCSCVWHFGLFHSSPVIR